MAEESRSCFCVGKRDFDVQSCTACQQGTSLELSSGLDRPLSRKRSRFQVIPDAEIDIMQKGYTPEKTETSTKWAIKNFLEWKESRRGTADTTVPEDILHCTDPDVLSHWLSRFAVETRMQSGMQYPPSTIYCLLAGVQRHMRSINPNAPTFLDKANKHFTALHNSLGVLFRSLRERNIGTSTSHHQPFTRDEIDQLWESGVIGTATPQSLLYAVFFYNGIQFCLRGGDEHRKLKLVQIQQDDTGYVYYENGSKNHKGTFSDRGIENKIVRSERVPEAGQRCHVHILDLYYSKLPSDAHQQEAFYFRPKPKTPKEGPWYSSVPIGKNKLAVMVSDMCAKAGLEKKTNHSLRATAATVLFQANIPEKVIQERTGHRSLEALRMYERSTQQQHSAASKILATNKSLDYEKAIHPGPSTEPLGRLPEGFSSGFNPVSLNIGSMSGCTVNISYNQPTPFTDHQPTQQEAMPTVTAEELEELLSDF